MSLHPKAARVAIGLLVVAVHVGLVLLLCIPPTVQDRATDAENAVPVYISLSARDSARHQIGGEEAEARPPGRLRAGGASRVRNHRRPLLAPRSAARVPPREQAKPPPAPIDWNAEAAQAAKQELAAEEAAQRRADALTRRDAVSAVISASLRPAPPAAPPFPWAPPRVQVVYGLGVMVRLNDHCVVIISVMVMVGCTIGKIEPRGDLFAHMHDVRDPEDLALP